MNVFELIGGELFALAFQVRNLSGDELPRAGSARELQENSLVRVARPTFAVRGDFKCLRQQRVTREDGNSFPEDLMIRQLAPAIIVVVHRRQVVVNERVGMDALDGAGKREGGCYSAPAGFGGGHAERRPNPLATGEEG